MTSKFRQNSTRLFAMLAIAAGAIACLSVVFIIWTLGSSSAAMDRAQQQGEAQLVRAVIKNYRKGLGTVIADYAAWTELYDYLQGPPNSGWEKDNLGPYLAQTFGIDDVFVISRSGRVAYAYRSRFAAPVVLSSDDQRILRHVAKSAFRAEAPDKQVPISGVISLHGTPAMIAASTIRSSSVKGISHFVLVEAHELTEHTTSAMGRDYGVSNLKIADKSEPGVGLATPFGTPSDFVLTWSAARSGDQLFASVFPKILATGCVAALAFVGLILAWSHFLEQLRVNERRMLDMELEASEVRARTAEEMTRSKSALIANMSHELRTPLNAIIGFSEVLQLETFGPLPSKKYLEYVKDIHHSGQHLLTIVNDILQLAKIEAGKLKLRLEPLDLEDALNDSVRMVDVLAAKRDIDIRIRKDSVPLLAFADRSALQQIFLNLLSNAIKFSDDGEAIEIALSHANGICEVRISDHGCGIPEDTLTELGNPFVQAEGAYARKYQGTGLGLSICFRLAEAIDASLLIDSAVGAGTTVVLKLLSAAADSRRSRAA